MRPRVDYFEEHPLPALRTTLAQYYSKRIQYHAKEIMRIEKGETGLGFFGESLCGKAASGHLSLTAFVECVEYLSDDTDFYAQMEAKLTPGKLRRVVEELAFIERPFTCANRFLKIAMEYSGGIVTLISFCSMVLHQGRSRHGTYPRMYSQPRRKYSRGSAKMLQSARMCMPR